MKRKILIISLMLSSTFCFSQEIQALFSSNDSSKTLSFGSYGGPLIETTHINSDWGLAIGGKGGVIINKKFAFGGIGKRLVSRNNFLGNNLNGNESTSLSLSYGSGGVFGEYIFNMVSPLHFSIPINLMAGGVSIEENNVDIESSTIFIFEPGINLEFNFSKYFISAINVSYRQVFGGSLKNLNNRDLSGLNIGLVFKFGNF
ncbi:MAG: hypothetical protein ABJN36_08130 [Cyclobacteriaceae bacterium]